MNITPKEICEKALDLGYAACGIIKVNDMRGYEDMINKRIERLPETQQYYSYFTRFAKPDEAESWVKSIIVCAFRYGKHKIPKELQGRIGKFYLTDYNVFKESEENKVAVLFDEYLTENGVKFKVGGTSEKYAAVKAGIGIIRKNNLLYTEHGSWVRLKTWLIDQDMEYICNVDLPPCPDDCTKCIDVCSTGSLAEPYQMNPLSCISNLTYGNLPGILPSEEQRKQMKSWVYGCDDCQDCCPMNRGCWTYEDDFPEIDDLQQYLTLEQLCTLDDEAIKDKISPVFYYIGHDKIWKWKTHALRIMAYQYEPKYLPYIEKALNDENEYVREMAEWAFEQIK